MAQFIRAFDDGSPTLLPISRVTQLYIKAMDWQLFAIVVVSLDENSQGMEYMVSTHDTEQGAREYMTLLLLMLNDRGEPTFSVGCDNHDMPHNP